jgi:uroporphyrinogen-III decarboxylase
MTPRERVTAAFEHRAPDRTPIFEREVKPPTDSVLLGREALHNDNWPGFMRKWAREGWDAVMEQAALDEFEIAYRLGFDLVRIVWNPPRSAQQPIEIDDVTFRNENGVWRYHKESGVVEHLDAKTASAGESERTFREQIDAEYTPPTVDDDTLYVYRRIRELFAEHGMDPAVYASLYALPIAALPAIALEWFITEPETLDRFYARQSRFVIDMARINIDEGADIIGLGGDFAGDKGSVISPRTYREMIVPHIRRQSDAIHEMGAWTTNTTDGVLWDVLDDFITGAGVDGYGEIDVAAGMDLGRLKREWGDRCVFLGNLDIRHVLCSGTVEEARAEMIRCIEQGQGNGGHIIMTSNVVHEDVVPELYLAAIDAYRDYYGLPSRDQLDPWR